jgi:hypothetical protein
MSTSEPWYNQPDTYGKQSSDAGGGSSPASAAKAVGKGALKVAGAAGRGLKKGAKAMSNFAANNPWGVRIISFVSSIGLFVIASLGIIGILWSDSTSRATFYVFNFYMLMLTAIVFVAECKDEWPGFGKLRPWTLEQFGFLQSNLGRGVYLFFIGIIWYGAWGWVWGLAGLAVLVVGLMYLAAHWAGSGIGPGKAPEGTKAPEPSKTITTKGAPNSDKHVELEEEVDDMA